MDVTSPDGLRHDALLYASDAELLDPLVPFLREGMSDGGAAVVVTTGSNIGLFRDALGSEAADVSFIDAAHWYRHPARTIAGYRDIVDERVAGGADHVRVVGEVQFGSGACQHREWTAYEALLNRAFANAPAWIVCPYDLRALPADVVRDAERTHPQVIRAGQRAPSADYVDPARLLPELAPPPPPRRGKVVVETPIGMQLDAARDLIREAARGCGLAAERSDHLVLAANEILTNGLLHGGGGVHLQIRMDEDSLECEISDEGAGFDDPFAGYVPPPAEDHPEGGMGLWLARQLCDALAVMRKPRGTAVLLRMLR